MLVLVTFMTSSSWFSWLLETRDDLRARSGRAVGGSALNIVLVQRRVAAGGHSRCEVCPRSWRERVADLHVARDAAELGARRRVVDGGGCGGDHAAMDLDTEVSVGRSRSHDAIETK